MVPVVIGESVRIPGWAATFEGFRRWVRADDFPQHGWFSHLNGDLWVDLGRENVIHNQLRGAFLCAIATLSRSEVPGYYLGSRMLLTNVEAQVATAPDGMFFSDDSLEAGRVQLPDGNDSMEVLGSPDMVFEVVSKSSVKKDTIVLRDLYWRAGVREYWLVDSRGAVKFDILRHGACRFSSTRSRDGWLRSLVFNRSFKLEQRTGSNGISDFTLRVEAS